MLLRYCRGRNSPQGVYWEGFYLDENLCIRIDEWLLECKMM